jgi:hypothetical protein
MLRNSFPSGSAEDAPADSPASCTTKWSDENDEPRLHDEGCILSRRSSDGCLWPTDPQRMNL